MKQLRPTTRRQYGQHTLLRAAMCAALAAQCGAATYEFSATGLSMLHGEMLVHSFGLGAGGVVSGHLCAHSHTHTLPAHVCVYVREDVIAWGYDLGRRMELAAQLCSAPAVAGNLTFLNPSLGPSYEHLDVTHAGMPALFMLLLALYTSAMVAWLGVCWKQREKVRTVHRLLAAVLVARFVEMVLALAHINDFGRTGARFSALNMAWSIAEIVSGALFLSLLLAVGFGWTTDGRQLQRRDAALFIVLIVVNIGVGVNRATCAEESCSADAMFEQLVRVTQMVTAMFAVYSQRVKIRAAVESESWSPHTPFAYEYLRILQEVEMPVTAYALLLPTFVITRLNLSDWANDWLYAVMQEGLTAWVYLAFAVAFRPRARTDFDAISEALEEWETHQRELQRGAQPVTVQDAAPPGLSLAGSSLWNRLQAWTRRGFVHMPSEAAVQQGPSAVRSRTGHLTHDHALVRSSSSSLHIRADNEVPEGTRGPARSSEGDDAGIELPAIAVQSVGAPATTRSRTADG